MLNIHIFKLYCWKLLFQGRASFSQSNKIPRDNIKAQRNHELATTNSGWVQKWHLKKSDAAGRPIAADLREGGGKKKVNLLACGRAEITFGLWNFLYLRVLIATSKRLKLLVTEAGSKKAFLSYSQWRKGQLGLRDFQMPGWPTFCNADDCLLEVTLTCPKEKYGHWSTGYGAGGTW